MCVGKKAHFTFWNSKNVFLIRVQCTVIRVKQITHV